MHLIEYNHKALVTMLFWFLVYVFMSVQPSTHVTLIGLLSLCVNFVIADLCLKGK